VGTSKVFSVFTWGQLFCRTTALSGNADETLFVRVNAELTDPGMPEGAADWERFRSGFGRPLGDPHPATKENSLTFHHHFKKKKKRPQAQDKGQEGEWFQRENVGGCEGRA